MEVDRLLDPVRDESPSGAELRNDARFHAIERLLEPAHRSYRLNEDGSINESAAQVDWRQVMDDSLALAEDGRDLRLLVVVVRALARLEGFPGLARGLRLLTDTIDRYWDSLHPEMRDRPDPAMACLPRTNALKQLENDDNGLLGDLKFTIAFTKRGLPSVYGRDLAEAALSDYEVLNRAPSGLGKDEQDEITGAHQKMVGRVTAACKALAAEEPEAAQELLGGIRESEAALDALIARFAEKGGFANGSGLALPELTDFLGLCRKTMEHAAAEVAGTPAPAEAAPDAAAPAATGAAAAVAVSAPGQIASRADVEACLDRIVEFYEKTEPSSPIPFFVRRVRRMVKMDFLELMEEVAPGGLKDFNALAGLNEGKGDKGK